MTIKEAQAAIAAILDSIPDAALPKFDKVETREDGRPIVWWGATGHHLGSATRNGQRDSQVLRDRAVWQAIEGEMTYRADKRLLANGDNPDGVKLAKKRVAR